MSYVNIYVILQRARNGQARPVKKTQWVFGITFLQFTPARSVFYVIDKKEAAVLHPLIWQHVLPDSSISTDQWAAYNGLDQ